jgi:Uma2 family endonuclease
MALPATLPFKTYDDLQAMPDDGHRYELIQGEIFMSPSPRRRHQVALMGLYDALRAHLREHPVGDLMLSPFDVKFSEATVVQPDLFVVRKERLGIMDDAFCAGPPDLVAEVLSPSNRGYDLIRKAALYLENRVPEYWVLDPDHANLMVNVWRDGRYVPEPIVGGIARSLILPGFSVPMSEIFPATDESMTSQEETE